MQNTLWATPERQRVLDVLKRNLFAGRCTFGHTNCPAMRKVQQAIVDKIGLPDEDNPFIWIMRAALVVGSLSLEPPKPAPLKPLPVIYHKSPDSPEFGKGETVVITGVSPKIKGAIWFERQRPTPEKGFLTADELRHLPTWLSTELTDYWKADDRDYRSYLWQLEKRHMHALPGIHNRGRYDSIAKSEAMAKRPLWEIVGMGVSAFTKGRTAKVYIPGLYVTIWVDLNGIKKPTQNAKRRWVRYGKGKAPESIQEQIESRCSQAVKRYLDAPC